MTILFIFQHWRLHDSHSVAITVACLSNSLFKHAWDLHEKVHNNNKPVSLATYQFLKSATTEQQETLLQDVLDDKISTFQARSKVVSYMMMMMMMIRVL